MSILSNQSLRMYQEQSRSLPAWDEQRARSDRDFEASRHLAGNWQTCRIGAQRCSWETEPWKTGEGAAFGGMVQLGVATVETDAGISGYGFVGSSMVGAEHTARGLIEFVKPHLVGEIPQGTRRLWWRTW